VSTLKPAWITQPFPIAVRSPGVVADVDDRLIFIPFPYWVFQGTHQDVAHLNRSSYHLGFTRGKGFYLGQLHCLMYLGTAGIV
jgi:hypothetical protein